MRCPRSTTDRRIQKESWANQHLQRENISFLKRQSINSTDTYQITATIPSPRSYSEMDSSVCHRPKLEIVYNITNVLRCHDPPSIHDRAVLPLQWHWSILYKDILRSATQTQCRFHARAKKKRDVWRNTRRLDYGQEEKALVRRNEILDSAEARWNEAMSKNSFWETACI